MKVVDGSVVLLFGEHTNVRREN